MSAGAGRALRRRLCVAFATRATRATLLGALLAAAAHPARAQVDDLPLTELPAKGNGTLFAVFLTGDGGWQSLDAGVSAQLVARGIPVVGFNQRDYLWHRKTPDQAGADLARIITTYAARWHRDSVVVIGYSRGAGIAPFAVNRLPAALRGTVRLVVLIGAEHGAGFQFHMRDIVRSGPAADDVPVLPELRKLGATPLMCFYGADEKDTLCPDLAPPAVVVKMSGGHHLDGAYADIGGKILGKVDSR
ncbi:MAG: AcvB/VirJ family lysyl-phosphatidylglycerol hydrolase [Gemmatimonadaceae bacterium]